MQRRAVIREIPGGLTVDATVQNFSVSREVDGTKTTFDSKSPNLFEEVFKLFALTEINNGTD